jgi:hypothetical protein
VDKSILDKPVTLCICVCIFWLMVVGGCVKYIKYIPDPVRDIDQWVENFAQQKSFSYEYEMVTPFVSVRASGDCLIGIGERLSGKWEREGEVQEFEYVGLGDIEYSKKGNDWEKTVRGEESDLFTQIRRLLSFDDFEYKGSEDGFFYGFRANVPFLAPDRRKEMVGFMRISSSDYLPTFIWAGLPDSSIYWTANVSKYNMGKNIKAPIREYRDYSVAPADTTSGDIRDAVLNRLRLADVHYRVESALGGLRISLGVQYALEDVQMMLSPGGLAAYRVVNEGGDAARTAYLKGDMYKPVFISELLFDESAVRSVVVRFDQRSTPYLELRLHDRMKIPATVAFEINGTLVATAALDTLRMLDRITVYPNMPYREIEILGAYIKQPLGVLKISPAVE